jgi:hypothetical protein
MTPTVLVFDVNETLLDITALEPVFAKIVGDPGREEGGRHRITRRPLGLD